MSEGLGIHIELTSNCNSKCLDCGRYVIGTSKINPYVDTGSKGNISLDAIENIFDEDICKISRYVNLTGTYGDFTLHPKAIDIIELIGTRRRQYNNEPMTFLAETNGGIRNDDWWNTLGDTIINNYNLKQSRVIFGIDGIDNETHQMYRRGVDFDSVIRHAQILISKGVSCRWSFIMFDHNAHQVEEAEKLSKEYGFKQFKIRRSRLRHKDTNIVHKKPKRWFERTKDIDPYVNETSIECEWKKKNQISIDYTGRVWQCCYFSNFYHHYMLPANIPYVNTYDYNDETRRYEKLDVYESRYAKNWNNVNYNTLSNILSHEFFTNDLQESFNNSTEHEVNPRIVRCSKFCGEKVRKYENNLDKTYASK